MSEPAMTPGAIPGGMMDDENPGGTDLGGGSMGEANPGAVEDDRPDDDLPIGSSGPETEDESADLSDLP
jgi:hypothetical protein